MSSWHMDSSDNQITVQQKILLCEIHVTKFWLSQFACGKVDVLNW